MNHLYDRAFGLFWAYMTRVDPLDRQVEARLFLALADKSNKSFRILMHQMMFALAFEDLFGAGNQEAFFRLVKDYNKTAPPGKHLGPKKFSSPKSLRAYLKKGQAHISGLSGKILRNYWEFAGPYAEPDFEPSES
jgi:hypothetical protein